jgi:hypothetical protein
MAKTWEQEQEILEQMRQDGVPDEDLVADDILSEKDGILLVRKSTLTYLAGDYFFGVSYEMWQDREMYNQGIYGEYLEDEDEDEIVYCIPLVGQDDEEALEQFRLALAEIQE